MTLIGTILGVLFGIGISAYLVKTNNEDWDK